MPTKDAGKIELGMILSREEADVSVTLVGFVTSGMQPFSIDKISNVNVVLIIKKVNIEIS